MPHLFWPTGQYPHHESTCAVPVPLPLSRYRESTPLQFRGQEAELANPPDSSEKAFNLAEKLFRNKKFERAFADFGIRSQDLSLTLAH